MLNKIWIAVSTFPVFLLSLIVPTDLYIYGLQDYNETLQYKYGNTTEKLKMEIKGKIERLFKECKSPIQGLPDTVSIYFEDKCKPIIDYYKNLGWQVTALYESPIDPKKDVIVISSDAMILGTCLKEKFGTHVLLSNLDECKKVREYYLDNGYDFVEKIGEGVELIQRQNSSQVNP